LYYQWHRKYGQEYETTTYSLTTETLNNGNLLSNKDIFYKVTSDWCSEIQTSWSMATQYNPCPAGWRVPTVAELQSIVDLFDDGEYTWVSDSRVFSPSIDIFGYWVGGNHAGDHNNSLFFPASGSIYINGSSVSRETFGHYSSTEHDNTSNKVNAFEFDNGSGSMVFALHHKAEALSVRCVKNGS
jgi:uncharacterized protein (TIGR02145 family)